MKLLSNKLQLVHTPRQRQLQVARRRLSVVTPSPQESREYQAQLELLATVLPPERFAWQLEGGMSVALHTGQFFRQHGDVDVAMFAQQLHEIESRLRQQNYRLFSRNAIHVLEYAPFDLLRATTADEIEGRKRVKRMMAVKVDDRGLVASAASPLPRFDVHVHRNARKYVYLDSDRIPFPRDLFEKTGLYRTVGGRTIRLASLPLMYFYKLQGNRPRHRFDLELIARHEQFSTEDRCRAYEVFLAHANKVRRPQQEAAVTFPIPRDAEHDAERHLPQTKRVA